MRSWQTVHEARKDGSWATDVGSDMGADALQEFFVMWTRLKDVQLDPDGLDSVRWSWEIYELYSGRSAYAAKFWGWEIAPMAEFTWP